MATKPKRPRDVNQLAKLIVDISTGEVEDQDPNVGKNPNKIESGRKGGTIGAAERAKKLTADERSEIAKKAAAIRWDKTKKITAQVP